MRDPDQDDDPPEPDAVRSVRRRSLGRRWRHLAEERLEDIEPALPIGKRFWPLSDEERAALETLFADPGLLRNVLGTDTGARLVDVAYWRKGCSSLGKLRYAAIVAITGGKGAVRHALIDIKEAAPSVAPAMAGATMPADPADRVVAGALALSPQLGERMVAARLLDRPIVLRELMPQDLKLEVDQFSQMEAVRAARYLAYVVGRAHARQMTASDRADWRRVMDAHPHDGVDAPQWLWTSIVDLAGSHEVGYLEHCRRYAMRTED